MMTFFSLSKQLFFCVSACVSNLPQSAVPPRPEALLLWCDLLRNKSLEVTGGIYLFFAYP